jgi:2-oxoglutarate ferredoxin oxidoreductase subunit alpha
MRELVDGAEAIVRGALDAGCDFFAGYPITPATPILLSLVRELPKVGGIAFQAEDEIAAIGVCIGAAMSGARVMTATSGPGISLYSENIGLAIMSEVPLVIVDCQRLGPATGGATTVGQGDIQFLRWGTSGGYPVIVLSPTNVPECYSLTRRAFDLAERFRVPVFIATDKEMVSTRVTVEAEAFEKPPVRERPLASAGGEFAPYRIDHLSDVPPMSPFGGPHLVRLSAASYNEHGYRAHRPEDLDRLGRHLAAKIEGHLDEIALVAADLQEGADVLVISYGITAGAAREAVRRARRQGVRVSSLIIYSLWPVPARQVRAAMTGVSRVVVAELNLGQYRREIECLAGSDRQVVGVHRIDGELVTPDDILERLSDG